MPRGSRVFMPGLVKDSSWMESIAVGRESLVEEVKNKRGITAVSKSGTNSDGVDFRFYKSPIPYTAHFDSEMGGLSVHLVADSGIRF